MSNSILDFTDEELIRRLREGSDNVYWSPANCIEELDRRAKNKNAEAMDRWTFYITIATVVNALAAIVQALAASGILKYS